MHAASYLGPEAPSPFAVKSEFYSNFFKLPLIPEFERYSFGDPYEKKILSLIHKYLELGTDDRLCYVGHDKGSMASLIQERFCVLEPITTVIPGHIHYEETENSKMVPVKIAHIGADEYFRGEANKGAQFDRVLLKDAVDYITDPKDTYKNIMRCLKPDGRLMIIHRPAMMNTLPLFTDARGHMTNMDQSFMDIIKDLQSLSLNVQWEIECLPIVMPKLKWMSMLQNKFPTHMEGMSKMDIRLGLRELSEGMLKYEGDVVEFTDRLLFISATSRVFSSYPSIQRFSTVHSPAKVNSGSHQGQSRSNGTRASADRLTYTMDITPNIEKHLSDKLKLQLNLRESGVFPQSKGKHK